MITPSKLSKWVLAAMVGVTCAAAQNIGAEPGNTLKLTIRGVPAEDAAQVSGNYQVSDGGTIRLPFVGNVKVLGLSSNRAGAVIEKAYRDAAIYQHPTVEAVILIRGPSDDVGMVSVGGYVTRAGKVPYRRGLRLVEALQGAGDRTPFGGRNIELIRGPKLILLDFRKPEVKNYELLPNDVITVKQRGPFERDRG